MLLIGLAQILAVVLGVATTALESTRVRATFNRGKLNTVNAMGQLVGGSNNPMLKVDNNGTGPAPRLHKLKDRADTRAGQIACPSL